MSIVAEIRISTTACRLFVGLSWCLLQIVSGLLIVTPKDLNVTTGDTVRLNCSTDSGKPVNWQFRKEPDRMRDIYINGEGLATYYKRLGRYSVEQDSVIGQFDLRIINTTFEDAGYYICSEPTGNDDGPHARLLVSGIDSLTTYCRTNAVIAINGTNVELVFSKCKQEPYYISHVPSNGGPSKEVFKRGIFIDSYGDGRFNVSHTNDNCLLSIESTRSQDAGTFTCIESLGFGERHAIELAFLESTPKCLLFNDSSHLSTSESTTEAICAINYTGHCVPLLNWWYHNISGTFNMDSRRSAQIQESSYSSVQSTSAIPTELDGQLTCDILQPIHPRKPRLQCNVSLRNDHIERSGKTVNEAKNSGAKIAIVVVIVAVAVAITIIIVALIRRRPRNLADCKISRDNHLRKKSCADAEKGNNQPETVILLNTGELKSSELRSPLEGTGTDPVQTSHLGDC